MFFPKSIQSEINRANSRFIRRFPAPHCPSPLSDLPGTLGHHRRVPIHRSDHHQPGSSAPVAMPWCSPLCGRPLSHPLASTPLPSSPLLPLPPLDSTKRHWTPLPRRHGRLRPHPCATAAREHGRSPQHHWPPRPFGRAARTHGTPETARTCPSRPSLAPTAMRRVHRAPAARL